jgi:hypothetical protein
MGNKMACRWVSQYASRNKKERKIVRLLSSLLPFLSTLSWPNPLVRSKVGNDGVENFTMLVGVALSDCVDNLQGNLTVFPGSHLQLEAAIRDAGGPEKLFHRDSRVDIADDHQTESLRNLKARVQLNNPVQLKLQAGDVVLAHYQLAHCVAPNSGANIRYQIYFRLHSCNHPPQTYRPETLKDIWLDYPAMVDIVRRNRPPVSSAALSLSSSSIDSPKVAEAQTYLNKAAELDRAMQFPAALQHYEAGLSMLLKVLQSETDQSRRARIKALVDKYMNRAEQIKAVIQGSTQV